jgi:hypothetical protein
VGVFRAAARAGIRLTDSVGLAPGAVTVDSDHLETREWAVIRDYPGGAVSDGGGGLNRAKAWCGGAVVRWCGGAVVRWCGGAGWQVCLERWVDRRGWSWPTGWDAGGLCDSGVPPIAGQACSVVRRVEVYV